MGACRLCGGPDLVQLLDLGKHPIAHHFLTDPHQEEYVHQVTLCFCERCGLIQLVNPVPPERLYTEYVCLSSWKHQPHIPRLLQLIEEWPGLHKTSRVVEVGSNDGTFLRALHERGYRKVIGVEPARDAQEAAQRKGIETLGGYFSQQTAQRLISHGGRCDVFIARQVLEHIADLDTFRDALRTVLAPGGVVIIEVPNFACNLATPDYTIWEEHVNYFTLETLNSFLTSAGIRLRHSETIVFSGESLLVIGEYLGDPQPLSAANDLGALRTQALAYRDRWPVFRDALITCLRAHQEQGLGVAIYGAGARVCSLINFAGIAAYITCILDDQPEKQGKYMPGSRLPIVPGEALAQQAIALCLLGVNTECEEAVIAKHRAWQAGGGRFASILPPSDRLLEVWPQERAATVGPAPKGLHAD